MFFFRSWCLEKLKPLAVSEQAMKAARAIADERKARATTETPPAEVVPPAVRQLARNVPIAMEHVPTPAPRPVIDDAPSLQAEFVVYRGSMDSGTVHHRAMGATMWGEARNEGA